MPKQHRVVDLRLSEPGLLISGGEDLHSHTLTLPLASPHLTIPPLTCRGKAGTPNMRIRYTTKLYIGLYMH